jgi:hypothetical protein
MSKTVVSCAAVAGAIAVCSLIAAAQPPMMSPMDHPDLVQRFLTSEEASPIAYQAMRRLEARNERFNADGWLDACTELTPGSGFRYRVIAEGGSSLIRGRVLKSALEGEREAWTSGEIDRNALGPANYEFQAIDGTDGDLRMVVVRPRRKSRMLVDGVMFLRPPDGDLVRVEGTLAKGPSFWTPRVEVVRRYARIAGVRVPVALESVAHVRMVGRSSFRMSYHYLSVNGHDVDGERDACATVEAGTPSSLTPATASGERPGSHVD